MNNYSKKSVIFKPSGRLGNAIFRYLASTILCMKYDMNFILHDDMDYSKINSFEYYPGVDHVGDDIEFTGYSSLNSLMEYVNKNDKIICFNTLGYLKNKCDLLNLTANDWINTNTNHGLYVKNISTITDDNYFDMVDALKDRNTNILMDGYFQFDYLYLKNKSEILQFINANKNEHYIQTDTNHRFLMKDIIDNMELPISKIYDIVIHIRLGDFNGRPDFIEYEYYEKLFQIIDFTNKRVCILLEPVNSESDAYFLNQCSEWFNKNTDITKTTITIESNDLMTDFNIMKQTKILVCSMSTLSWSAAYFSTILETCYMPNYNFYEISDRTPGTFKKPIENTILYDVKTTNKKLEKLKIVIMTLKEYPERLNNLTHFIYKFSQLGLRYEICYGINGINIKKSDTTNENIKLLSHDRDPKTYTYDKTIRTNNQIMGAGELGCAWSHLSFYNKLVNDMEYDNYLIFEDDVELVSTLEQLYNTLCNIPETFDFCHIAKSDWYPFIKINKINDHFYTCKKQYFNRTTAYIVSKTGANKLIHRANNCINIPADDLLCDIYLNTPDFTIYVPESYLFHEPENTISINCIINSL